jgi:hypothetical protein
METVQTPGAVAARLGDSESAMDLVEGAAWRLTKGCWPL